jgi:hypothetical protein
MFQERNQKTWILSILILGLTAGCDERATQIALEAADRQAQQNTAMAELNQEVAGGSRELVTADAQARKEIVIVHRQLQAERNRLDTGWNALEQERRQIAHTRRTESMLVPVAAICGGLLLASVLLGFCWYALVAAHRGEHTDAQLNELLIREFVADQPPLFSCCQRSSSLLDYAEPDDPQAE